MAEETTQLSHCDRLAALRRSVATALSDARYEMRQPLRLASPAEELDDETAEDRACSVRDMLWSELAHILVDHHEGGLVGEDPDAAMLDYLLSIVNHRRLAAGKRRLALAFPIPVMGIIVPDAELDNRVSWNSRRES